MENLAKVAYNAWRAGGGLATLLAPEFEDLSWAAKNLWDAVSQAVLEAASPKSEES
jgi:hypothetical protein